MKLVIFVLLLFVTDISFAEKPRLASHHLDTMKWFVEGMEIPFHTKELESTSYKSSRLEYNFSWRPRWRLVYVENKFYCDIGLGKDDKKNLLFIEGRFNLR